MNREQVYQRVVELIQDEKGEDFDVQPESTLADNIAADSVEITGKGAGYLSGDQFHGAGRFRSGAVCNDPGNVC